MRIRIAVLADYASVSLGEKLNVMGIFSNISARAEPIVHAQMYLVIQLEFDSAEAGKKVVKVVLQDDDGNDLLSVGGEMNVPRAAHGEPAIVNQIIVLNNTSFPKFGRYEFRVLINERTEEVIPLSVSQVRETLQA